MRIARLFVLTFALMIGAAAVAEAQQGQRGNRGMNPAAMLLQNIELTAEQKTRTDSIAAKYTATMQANRERMQPGTPPDSAARAEMQKVRATLQADLRAVLTSEQQAVFDKNVEAMAQRQQRRPPPAAIR